MRVASFFSGIGGFDLGFEQAGMEVVFQCEKNDFACQVLKKHWPNVPLHGDIKTLKSEDVPQADLYCGGFPCQDLSLANQGKRQGLSGDRSGLFYEYARLIEDNTPKWVIIENVPGLLNSHKGKDFRILLQKMDDLGYGVAWRIFDAKYFGTPQRRRRVFIVASHQSLRAAAVLFDDALHKIAPSKSQGKAKAVISRLRKSPKDATLYTIQHAAVGRKHTAGPQSKGYRNDGETWTLDSRGSGDVICSTTDSFGVRATSGLSDRMDSARYRAVGNAVCVSVATWIGKRIMRVESGELDESEGLYPYNHAPTPEHDQLSMFS